MYAADAWQLLVDLHRKDWTVVACDPKEKSSKLAPFIVQEVQPLPLADGPVPQADGPARLADGPARPNKRLYITKVNAKRKHIPSFNRSYLVLLASAPLLHFPEPIPHLASPEVYSILLDSAFPHHAEMRRKKNTHSAQGAY